MTMRYAALLSDKKFRIDLANSITDHEAMKDFLKSLGLDEYDRFALNRTVLIILVELFEGTEKGYWLGKVHDRDTAIELGVEKYYPITKPCNHECDYRTNPNGRSGYCEECNKLAGKKLRDKRKNK